MYFILTMLPIGSITLVAILFAIQFPAFPKVNNVPAAPKVNPVTTPAVLQIPLPTKLDVGRPILVDPQYGHLSLFSSSIIIKSWFHI